MKGPSRRRGNQGLLETIAFANAPQ
ncbi:Protein of unknown function [Propionibacterium freudenreichii]|nr:Protein of unknown function [Propionibacterium freudenreichii]